MDTTRDAAFMRRALELARHGRGFTHPNPMVGAVVVQGGAIIGEGYHQEYGGPHAEVVALRAAGPAARGATLYISLEPCAHHGKTPPCTEAVLDAGIARVVYAAADPNPRARGGGEVLRAAGVAVSAGVEADAARELNAIFFGVHERGAPFVSLKLALSLDGSIAAAPGQRTQLTGPEARRETHRLRADHEAVLVGSRTAHVDDPLLTVRDVACRIPPVRVVVATDADLPVPSRLLGTVAEAPVWVICATDAPAARTQALEQAGVRVCRVPRSPAGRIDPAHVRAALAAGGIRSVLVEGGAKLAASLLDAGLVDRMHLLLAPLLTGADGVRGLQARLASRWQYTARQRLGNDLLITLQPADRAGGVR